MSHFRIKNALCAWIVIFVGGLYCTMSYATDANLFLSFEEQYLLPGSQFQVNVQLRTDINELGSYAFTLIYNRNVLQIYSIDGGISGNIETANQEGRIKITSFSSWPDSPDNTIHLSKITFNVIGDYCTTSELTFSNVSLYDPYSIPFSSQLSHSEIDVICPMAKINGIPKTILNVPNLTLQIDGTEITYYKYWINNDTISNELPVTKPISLSSLTDGNYQLSVIGKINDKWQSIEDATQAKWAVYIPTPIVNLITPKFGSVKGGTELVCSGTYFLEDTEVLIDGSPISKQSITSETITIVTPPHSFKAVDITFRNPDGKQTIKKQAFMYLPDDPLFQIVYSQSNYIKIAPGASFQLPILYSTSDINNNLSGLGLRIHFNSNVLEWNGISNLYPVGKQGEDLDPKNDVKNTDNDLLTDKRLIMAWLDIDRNWSGNELPQTLAILNYTVSPTVNKNETSAIRFSASSTASTHQFLYAPIILDFQPWTITCVADINGDISPSKTVILSHGDDQQFDFIPDSHFHVKDVRIDNVSIGSVEHYVFHNVSSDHTIQVEFEIDTVTLTIEKKGTGTGIVRPNVGIYTNHYGSAYNLSAFPSESSDFKGWSGDRVSENTMTTIIMDSDKTIVATFDIKTFTITPTAGENGSIVPSEPISILYNQSQMFKMLADRCYEVNDVVINGESRGKRLNHNFMNITSDQTIDVTFKPRDRDEDGLPDCIETNTGCTKVDVQDSDGDGILDGQEDANQNGIVDNGETHPCMDDTDSDGMKDGWEIIGGLNPTQNDATDDLDHDGYSNLQEARNGTLPHQQDLPYGINYDATTDNRQPYQIISATPLQINISSGGILTVDVIYSNYLMNYHLDGIDFRIHFNSNQLTWLKLDNLFSQDLKTTSILPQADTENFDQDPDTDQYIQVSWFDPQNQWPGNSLSVKLYSSLFAVDPLLEDGQMGHIRFSSSKCSDGFNFYANHVTYDIRSGNLDIDGNGKDDALTDGLLIMSYLFGFRNTQLVDQAIGSYATRSSANDIVSILKEMNQQMLFDVDGNGKVNALADGLLIVRYLFGFRDYELIYDIKTPDCTRCTPAEIETYLRHIKPVSNNSKTTD